MKYTQYIAMTVLSMMGTGGIYAMPSNNSVQTAQPIEQPACAFGPKCNVTPQRSCNFWVSGDLIVWGVCEDGFSCEFGDTTINTNIVDGLPTTAITEHDVDLDFKWEPGFRVGIGIDGPCSGWDTGAFWTWYHGKGHGKDGLNHASWWLHYNVIDAVLGRRFWVGSCVNLRPFTGLRYAHIKQRLRSNLQTEIIAATGNSIVHSMYHDTQTLWGFGPQLGLEADFYIGNRWSIYGNIDGAILYGHTTTHYNDEDTFALANNVCVSSSESCSNEYVLDLGLGLRYEFKYLTLQAGLEQHTYFDFNQIGCCGNLNLYGANFSAAVHF